MMAAGMASAERGPAEPRGELDRATLERCKARDPAAFRAFVTRYERPVFALLSRLLGRGPHVEDLAQEAFLRASRALPQFDLDGPARPSTWLLTIATRLALDAKKARRVPTDPLEAGHQVAHGPTPEAERARAELGRALASAAARLSDDQRAAFLLAEVHGFSVAEVAAALEIPENTAKTRLFRARQAMRESLTKLWSEA